METIDVTRENAIVTVTLNRPAKKNAANETMWMELRQTFLDLGEDRSVRAVVVTGAGGSFCSGADLSAGGETAHMGRDPRSVMRLVGDTALALHRLPQPTIAKVRGVAVGAGANLAFGCDLIVACDDARFSEIFAKRSLSIDFGGSWILPRLVGMQRAKELAFFADIISAAQAFDFGLVNRVLSNEGLDAFVDDWASRLAAGPPIALAQTKRMLNNAFAVTFEQALDDEGAAQAYNFTTNDTEEAMHAFVEKRAPVFSGR